MIDQHVHMIDAIKINGIEQQNIAVEKGIYDRPTCIYDRTCSRL